MTLDGDCSDLRRQRADPVRAAAAARRRAARLTVAGAGLGALLALKQNEHRSFVLECGDERPSGGEALEDLLSKAFNETIAYWQSWSAHSSYRRPLARARDALGARA